MEHFINTDLSSSSVKGAVSSEGGSEGWVYEHQGGTQELPACMLAGVGIISLFGDVSKSLGNSLIPRQVLSILIRAVESDFKKSNKSRMPKSF